MREKKQTFIDPKAGEEIESPWLARSVRKFVSGMGLLPTLIPLALLITGAYKPGLVLLFLTWVLAWLIRKLAHEYFFDYARAHQFNPTDWERLKSRRQRLFHRQAYADVPDRALSRVHLPSPPQPTDRSVSQADVPEEDKPRLSEAVEEEPRPGLWQTIKGRWGGPP